MCLRNLTVICLVLAIGTACTQEASPSYTTIEGKFPAGTEVVKISYGDKSKDLHPAEDGTFIDTLSITTHGYVDFYFGDRNFWIYAAPGDEMIISVDSILTFSGSNAEINDYLYQEVLVGTEQFDSFQKVFTMEETEFVHREDSIKADKLNSLAQLPAGTEIFQDFHRKAINYDYQFNVAQYTKYHSYFVKDYEPTEVITNIYKDVSLNNETDAQNYGAYRSLVSQVLDQRVANMGDTSLSTLEANLDVLNNIQSPTILHQQLKNALYYFNANVKDMEGMRDRMLAMAKLNKTKEAITKHYEVVSLLKPGSPSPSFDYENYVGGNTKLADLKGKYLYIDIWATWCGPCLGEIPHLKKVEKEFHDADIEFVSISIDELQSRDKWRNMIKKRELGGTQLLADNDWNSDFIQSYGIRGIPRFILLDDKGNIVSADAERPSNPQLTERLQAIVQN